MDGYDDDDAALGFGGGGVGAPTPDDLAMQEWGIAGADANTDDIGAYVAAKQQRRRLRDDRQNFAPPSKLYGYQEPKSVAKVARPRVLPSLDNGGWNNHTGDGKIPRYAWQEDPLRKKAVPSVVAAKTTARSTNARQQRLNALAAPTRRVEPASAPAASRRTQSQQPPKLAVPRSGSRPLQPGPGRAGRAVLPPIGRTQSTAQRGRSLQPIDRHAAPRRSHSSDAASRQGTSAPRDKSVPRSDDDDDGMPVPPQHPYRGTMAQKARVPPLHKATVSAYSRPALARKRLEGLKASPRSHQPSPRKEGQVSSRPTEHRVWAPADDGGEHPTPRRESGLAPSPRREGVPDRHGCGDGSGGEDMESPRPNEPPKPPEPTPAQAAQAAIDRLRGMIAMEKQERLQLSDAKACAAVEVEEAKDAATREKALQKQSQKAQKTLVTAERERNTLLATKRRKDKELKELRGMISNLGHRVDELRVQAAVDGAASTSPRHTLSPRRGEGVSELDEIGDRMALRDTAKSKTVLKQNIARLKDEQLYLQDELARVQAAASDRHLREALIQDRILRERRGAVAELKERLAAELDRELARIRDNHTKAIRHRERELEQRQAEEERAAEAHNQRVNAAIVGGGAAAKSVAETRVALATQSGIVEELTRQTDALQARHEAGTASLLAKRRAVSTLQDSIRSLEKQREVSSTASGAAQAAKGKFDDERNRLRAQLDAAKAAEKSHVAELASRETILEHLQSELLAKRRKVEAAKGVSREQAIAKKHAATKARDEAARRLADAKAAVKAAKKRKAAAEAAGDMSAKDAEIERLTKQVAFATAARKDVAVEGEQLLQRLDDAERLVSMSALH